MKLQEFYEGQAFDAYEYFGAHEEKEDVYKRQGFKWTEENGKVEAGNVTAGASDQAAAYHEKTFEMKVLTPGEGVLTFVGAEGHNAPQLDKFDIVAKEVQTVEYNVCLLYTSRCV